MNDRCETCGWAWLRKDCRPGVDKEGRRYCFHRNCEDPWHDQQIGEESENV